MIYYIYKVRRKQTSIRFFRFKLPHRYLRYISWISWNGGHSPLHAGFHPVPQPARALFSRRCLYPKAAIAATLSLPPPRGHSKHPSNLFPRKKKTSIFPFSRTALTRRSSLCCSARGSSHVLPATHPRPVHHSLLRPSHKQKNAGPRHYAANPQKCRLLAQENARRHAWLSRSCFGRENLFIDGPHCPFSFLLFYKGKEKRKQKQIQQVRIHRSDSLRSSSRCTRLARRASSAEIYVAIATRFVRDCVEDLAVLTASMERIPRCSWHIKDHYLGVNKASRISPYFCVLFSS